MEYALVTHFGSGMVRHQLEAESLVVVHEKTGRRDAIPFSDITEINLRQEMQGVHSVRVARRAGKTITIPARHFVALGQFENRGPEYAVFVEALHLRAHAANPAIVFVAGSSVLYWLGWFFVVFGALFSALVAYALLFSPKPFPRRVLPVIPLTFVVGGMFIRQGRAKPYPPDQLPAKMLPPHG